MKYLLPVLSFIFICFGVATFDWEVHMWGYLAIALYLIPALTLLQKNKLIKSYAAWFGMFLMGQTALSVFFYRHYYHLPANMSYKIDVQGDGLPGISGLQSITTDRMGFRTTKTIDYEKKSNALRIFALGASTTELIYIDDRKAWTHLLQEKLEASLKRPVEVINASVSGLRLVHIYENFRKILKYHPDMALFLIGANDWNHDILGHFDPKVLQLHDAYSRFGMDYHSITKTYLRNTLLGLTFQNLALEISSPDNRNIASEIRAEKGEFYARLNNSLSRKDVRKYEPKDVLPEYLSYLEKTAALCKAHHVECVFITQPHAYKAGVDEKTKRTFWMTPPSFEYTLDLESMGKVAELYNTKLKLFASERSITLCDLDSVLPPSQEIFYDDAHFNEKGSEAVSDFLLHCLTDKAFEVVKGN